MTRLRLDMEISIAALAVFFNSTDAAASFNIALFDLKNGNAISRWVLAERKVLNSAIKKHVQTHF